MQANQIAERSLPSHVIENYPDLVRFMAAFYEWNLRSGALTKDEFEFLVSQHPEVEWDDSSIQGQGFRSLNRLKEHNLIRCFDFFETSDYELFETLDGELFETEKDNPTLDLWYKQFGDYQRLGLGSIETTDNFVLSSGGFLTSDGSIFKVQAANVFSEFRDIDDIRLIKLLKIIYGMKGSVGTMNLFFSVCFGETVTIERTKNKIARIDDNFILDGTNVMRDDDKYSEYSYIVFVSRDVEFYTDLFETLYLKHFHPAGFKVFLEKKG